MNFMDEEAETLSLKYILEKTFRCGGKRNLVNKLWWNFLLQSFYIDFYNAFTLLSKEKGSRWRKRMIFKNKFIESFSFANNEQRRKFNKLILWILKTFILHLKICYLKSFLFANYESQNQINYSCWFNNLKYNVLKRKI